VTGADFIQHHVASAGVLFSPGPKADGSPFNTVMFLTKSLNNASWICTGPIEKSFRIGGNKPLPFQKEILDSRGKCLKTLSEGESEFSMRGFPAGVYQVRILASKSQNLKFILH